MFQFVNQYMINKRERERQIDIIKEFENKNNTPFTHTPTHPRTWSKRDDEQGKLSMTTKQADQGRKQRYVQNTKTRSNNQFEVLIHGKKQGYDRLYTWILHLDEVGLE